MSCPHAETTTVAWLHGDAHEHHALHVASCADCAAVLDLHERVGRTTARVVQLLHRPEGPRRSVVWVPAFAVAAIAAGALLAFALSPAPPVVPVSAAVDSFSDPLDAEIADLAARIEVPADEFTSL